MFFRGVLSAKNCQLCRVRAEPSKAVDLEPLHASPTSSYKALIFHFCIYYTLYHVVTTYNQYHYPALFQPCPLLDSLLRVLEYGPIACKEDNAKHPPLHYLDHIANMPLTVLSSADIHSLLLTLTRDDIAELQYVVSKPTFPPLNQTLRLETCLDSLYPRNMFQSLNASWKRRC